jgi:hypothetical protein
LLGWEPTESHVHEYDDEGRLVRTTVTREPEWDDQQRANMLALAEYEAGICACGLPKDLADADPDLRLKYRVCPVCAGMAQATRVQHAYDEQDARTLGKNPAPGLPRPTDGRHFAGFEPVTTDEEG